MSLSYCKALRSVSFDGSGEKDVAVRYGALVPAG